MISQLSHNSEWLASAVDADIIELNVKAIDGSIAFEYLYGHAVQRLQNGGHTLNSFWMRKYREFEVTEGWWVTGVDPLNDFERSDWGRYKPTKGQIFDKQKGKPAKYLSPAKRESHPIFLDVPHHIWAKIALRYGINVDFGQYKNFWEWVANTPSIPIYKTEGEKKAGALLTAGYAAVSLPGVWMGTKKNPIINKHELRKDLKIFDVLGRQINIIFDFEKSYKKASKINKAATTLGYCFKSAKAFIGYLPGPAKGVDDFLVSGGDFESVKFKTLSQIKAEKSWGMNYQPDIPLNHQYIPDLSLPSDGLTCIKSPMGTGKTTLLNPIVSAAYGRGQGVLVIGHRKNLVRDLCSKINLPYIEDVRSHYVDENGKVLKDGRFAGFGLCIDSLHAEGQGQINPRDWEGKIVILDEWEQCLWHLLNSNTCKNTRVKILETFRQLIEIVLSSGGHVIAMDAHLSDKGINYLRQQSGFNIKPFIVRNDWKTSTPWTVKVFDSEPVSNKRKKIKDNATGIFKEADKVLDLNEGKGIWFSVDSQQVTSTYGTINIETRFKKTHPDKRIIRIDSETTADPTHPAYGITGNVNEVVKDYDIVICSPSISTGLSVDIKGHFAAVFAIFQGAIPINDCLQSLARVREAIPRYIWTKKQAVGRLAGGEVSPPQIRRNKDEEIKTIVRLLELSDFDMGEDLHHSSLHIWAEMVARINAAGNNLRESLINLLKEEGHNVEFFSDTDETVLSDLKDIKQENIDKEAVEVINAADCTDSQFEDLKKKQTKTRTEQLTEKKHALKKAYGEKHLCTQLKKLNDTRGWKAGIRFYYYLTHNPAFVKLRDTLLIEGHKERGAGKVCAQDIKPLFSSVAAYKRLGFLDFTDGREITKHDPKVKEVAALCLQHASLLRFLFGVTVTAEMVEKTPIKVIQMFLKLVGLKLTKEKQQRIPGTGERPWVYKFGGFSSRIEAETPDLRQAIFADWEQRDIAALADYEARLADNLGVA